MLNNPQFAFSLLKSGTHEVDNKTLSEPRQVLRLTQKVRQEYEPLEKGK